MADLDVIDSVIQSAIMSQYIFSKARFDNAKDTTALLEASKENAEMLTNAIKYRFQDRVDQMLIDRIDRTIEDGEMVVRIKDRWYKLEEVKATTEA